MINHNYVWLLDENHHKKSFNELPRHISNLANDPYRSLAWLVRERGGFNKVPVNFLEFKWAMFFKSQGIKINSNRPNDISSVLKRALSLACSQKASHLPGFKYKRH